MRLDCDPQFYRGVRHYDEQCHNDNVDHFFDGIDRDDRVHHKIDDADFAARNLDCSDHNANRNVNRFFDDLREFFLFAMTYPHNQGFQSGLHMVHVVLRIHR